MTVQQIYDIIQEVAPFETQAEFDNSGLLIGDPNQDVTDVLFALDVTDAVLDEAESTGVQLIVTHHPLMFTPRSRITEEDTEGRLIRRLIRLNISLISAHTNLDQAPDGINDTLAALCGLRRETVTGDGYFRTGLLPEPMNAAQYAEFLSENLHTVVRVMGPQDVLILSVGLCSGSGSSEYSRAIEEGCSAFVTGEMKHDKALLLAEHGIVTFECGHAATETPGICALAEALQNALNQVEYGVRVYQSAVPAYAFSMYD